jgi:hypothetical protein
MEVPPLKTPQHGIGVCSGIGAGGGCHVLNSAQSLSPPPSLPFRAARE